MKVGLPYNKKTLEDDWTKIKAFGDAHWERIQARGVSGWRDFPKYNTFISFCESDRVLMESLSTRLMKSPLLNPVVVESYSMAGDDLGSIIIDKMHECRFFISILSTSSIKTQWVNQELGYSKSIKGLKIIPVVEKRVIKRLKGFVHNQLQLPYSFTLDNRSYIDLFDGLVTNIEDQIAEDLSIEMWRKVDL